MTAANAYTSHDAGARGLADIVLLLLRFWRAARSRKSCLLAALAITAFLGTVYYFTAPRVYRATASLLVLQTGAEVWDTAMSHEGGRQDLIPTYERLFTSAVVVDRALEQLAQSAPVCRADFLSVPPEDWARVLRDNLSASGVRRTNIIEIAYRSSHPRAAVAVVDAVVQAYLEFMEENHKSVSLEIVSVLDKERKEVEGKLAVKQQQLREVGHRVRAMGLEHHATVVHPTVQRVVSLNETLVEVQRERLQLEASLTAVRAAIRQGGDVRHHLATVEPVVGQEMILSALGLDPESNEMLHQVEQQLISDRAKLDSLSQHYGPGHLRIVELRQTIRNAEHYVQQHQSTVNQRLERLRDGQLSTMLVAMIEERLAKAWAHENELRRQYALAEQEAVELNDRVAELTLVEHDLRLLRSLHDTLLNRIASIDIKQDQADVRVAIVSEPAASDEAVSPRLSVVAALCLLSGVGGGAILVYVLDVLDDRFRSPEEIKLQLGVPVLAMVRRLPETAASGIRSLPVHAAPKSAESEAFRTLRTTLAFSGRETQRVAITSSQPGDGKTTVLANLGAAFAQAGRRTLLIDADLRRPGLTRLFGMRGTGGLSRVLRSSEEVGELSGTMVQPSGIDRLDVLPCGPKPPDPAELLSGPRMADLIAWAETQYDQVLIDCPPVMAASDAAIVGRLVDGTMLVVQPEKNHRRLVLRTADHLLSMRVSLVGVVTNRVGSERDGVYDYGYGSGHGYGYGYGHEDDDDDDDEPSEVNHGDTARESSAGLVRPRPGSAATPPGNEARRAA